MSSFEYYLKQIIEQKDEIFSLQKNIIQMKDEKIKELEKKVQKVRKIIFNVLQSMEEIKLLLTFRI